MAKISLSKILVTAGAIVGACAGTYYYLTQKNQNDDDFEEFEEIDSATSNRSYVDLSGTVSETNDESVSEKAQDNADSLSEGNQNADEFKEGLNTTNVHAADKILGQAATAVENAKQVVEDAADEVEEFFDDEDEE